MINTIRLRSKRPARVFAAIDLNPAKKQKVEESAPKRGFFEGFFKMWEHQAGLVIRNIDEDSKY